MAGQTYSEQQKGLCGHLDLLPPDFVSTYSM